MLLGFSNFFRLLFSTSHLKRSHRAMIKFRRMEWRTLGTKYRSTKKTVQGAESTFNGCSVSSAGCEDPPDCFIHDWMAAARCWGWKIFHLVHFRELLLSLFSYSSFLLSLAVFFWCIIFPPGPARAFNSNERAQSPEWKGCGPGPRSNTMSQQGESRNYRSSSARRLMRLFISSTRRLILQKK